MSKILAAFFVVIMAPLVGAQSINGIPNQNLSGVVPTTPGVNTSTPSGKLVAIPKLAQLFCAGDSYVNGSGATTPPNSICPLLARDTQAPMQNVAHNGYVTPQIAVAVFGSYAPDPNFPSVVYLDAGTNDAGNDSCGGVAGTTCIVNYQLSLDATLAWLSIPYTQRQMASVATAASFTADTTSLPIYSSSLYSSPGTPMAATASGATLTFSIPSSAATKIGITQTAPPTNSGTFTISIDGTPQTNPCTGTTTFSGGPCGGSLVVSSTQTAERNEFSVTAGTSHTVVITTTAVGGVTIVGVDWVLPTPSAITNPVFFMNINAYQTNYALYNTAASTILSREAAAGLPIFLVDQPGGTPGVNATTDLSASATATCPASAAVNHPNDCGYEHMRETVQNVEYASGYIFGAPNSARNGCNDCLIATITPNGTNAVTLNVLSGYTDLIVVVRGASDYASAAFSTIYLQFNGDTANNYEFEMEQANGSTVTGVNSLAANEIFGGWLPAAGGVSNDSGYADIAVSDYANTSFNKTTTMRSGLRTGTTATTSFYAITGTGWWSGTAGITSVTVKLDNGNFKAGSRISVYGRK